MKDTEAMEFEAPAFNEDQSLGEVQDQINLRPASELELLL
jgi:hypothetical protein